MTVYHQKLPPSGEAREALRKKGQFWTPAWIAEAMAAYVLADGSDQVFDPAVGEGAFLRAAKQESLRLGRPLRLLGTEVDLEILRQARTDTLTEEDLAGIEARDFLFDPPRLLTTRSSPTRLISGIIGLLLKTSRLLRNGAVTFSAKP